MDLIYRFDPYRAIVIDRPADAQAARHALVAGNERLLSFVTHLQTGLLEGEAAKPAVVPVDLVSLGLPVISGVALDQQPFALVLGCSDARVPVERVFDLSFNDLFVVRIAGNVLGIECLGSFDYAVRSFHESLKLVVVLGHSGCGAVTAAVDAYLHPSGYAEIAFTHALRSLVDRIMLAVRTASRSLDEVHGEAFRDQPGYRAALIETSIYLNAAITAFDLWREALSLGRADLEVAYGVFDISTLQVSSTPTSERLTDADPLSRLGPAPRSAEDFLSLAHRFAGLAVATD
jgi:carbonic anhydrase